jgi:hypothetical protein
VSQYRRSFEIVEITWRVRNKYTVAPDASNRPPLRADDFIDLKLGICAVCASRRCLLHADHLLQKLAPPRRLSTVNTISLFNNLQLPRLSASAARAPRKALKPWAWILASSLLGRECVNWSGTPVRIPAAAPSVSPALAKPGEPATSHPKATSEPHQRQSALRSIAKEDTSTSRSAALPARCCDGERATEDGNAEWRTADEQVQAAWCRLGGSRSLRLDFRSLTSQTRAKLDGI